MNLEKAKGSLLSTLILFVCGVVGVFGLPLRAEADLLLSSEQSRLAVDLDTFSRFFVIPQTKEGEASLSSSQDRFLDPVAAFEHGLLNLSSMDLDFLDRTTSWLLSAGLEDYLVLSDGTAQYRNADERDAFSKAAYRSEELERLALTESEAEKYRIYREKSPKVYADSLHGSRPAPYLGEPLQPTPHLAFGSTNPFHSFRPRSPNSEEENSGHFSQEQEAQGAEDRGDETSFVGAGERPEFGPFDPASDSKITQASTHLSGSRSSESSGAEAQPFRAKQFEKPFSRLKTTQKEDRADKKGTNVSQQNSQKKSQEPVENSVFESSRKPFENDLERAAHSEPVEQIEPLDSEEKGVSKPDSHQDSEQLRESVRAALEQGNEGDVVSAAKAIVEKVKSDLKVQNEISLLDQTLEDLRQREGEEVQFASLAGTFRGLDRNGRDREAKVFSISRTENGVFVLNTLSGMPIYLNSIEELRAGFVSPQTSEEWNDYMNAYVAARSISQFLMQGPQGQLILARQQGDRYLSSEGDLLGFPYTPVDLGRIPEVDSERAKAKEIAQRYLAKDFQLLRPYQPEEAEELRRAVLLSRASTRYIKRGPGVIRLKHLHSVNERGIRKELPNETPAELLDPSDPSDFGGTSRSAH